MSCIRTTITATAVGSLLFVVGPMAHEGEKHPAQSSDSTAAAPPEKPEIDRQLIEGEIVDITCYIRHDSRGPEHLKCALFCAEMGMPLGLLEDGTEAIYLILPSGHADPRETVLPFVSKKVRVSGIPWISGGLTAIEIEAIEELGKDQ
jgi:hypothetical protein